MVSLNQLEIPKVSFIVDLNKFYKQKEHLLSGGIYQFIHKDKIIYIGETNNLYRRFTEHMALDKYAMSEFDKYKKKFKDEIEVHVIYENDFTFREIYESLLIRLNNPVFNILKTEKRYKTKNDVFNENLIIANDNLFNNIEDLKIESIDRTNIQCEKNAVIISKYYLLSQLTQDEVIRKFYMIDKKDFNFLWKKYKETAMKHRLKPIVENANIIFNSSLKKMLKVVGNKYVLSE